MHGLYVISAGKVVINLPRMYVRHVISVGKVVINFKIGNVWALYDYRGKISPRVNWNQCKTRD